MGARRERDVAPRPADEHDTMIPAASATDKMRAMAQYFLLMFLKKQSFLDKIPYLCRQSRQKSPKTPSG
jgi:hypothetical protein